jgi:peptidoglycan/LPS O-acetylase OafA/YrhL
MLQAWVPSAALLWNAPAWSLSCEAFFCLAFPFVVVQATRTPTAKLLVLMLCLLGVSPLAYLGVHTARLPETLALFAQGILEHNPLLQLSTFCVGVIVGVLYRVRGLSDSRYGVWTAGLAIVGSIGLVVAAPGVVDQFGSGVVLPLFAILIYSLAVSDGGLARLLSLRVLVFLGECSYALYLLQFPVYSLQHAVAVRLPVQVIREGETAYFVVYLVLLVAFAIGTHVYVERPARAFIKQKLLGTGQPETGRARFPLLRPA